METTTPTKTRMPIHYIVKNYGYGAVSLLAKELGKSPTLMSITLAQKRISIKGEIEIQKAMKKVFGKDFTRDELFR